jgi:hypothetical protein
MANVDSALAAIHAPSTNAQAMDLLGERMTKARPSLGLISTGFIVSLLELLPGEGYIARASNAARFVD